MAADHQKYVDNAIACYGTRFLTPDSPDLLKAVLDAHGGLEQWQKVKAITINCTFSGGLITQKGYPGHHQMTLRAEATEQKTVIQGLGGNQKRRIYTPLRTVVEQTFGDSPPDIRDHPRASFAGHERATLWDDHHLTYFTGYAFWYYLTMPFCFTLPGFKTREIEEFKERDEVWRVLEVTFPDYFGTHCRVQQFFYDKDFLIRRMDYQAEVVSGVHVKHYCYDYKVVSGINIPLLRRVWSFSERSTSFLIDIIDVKVDFKDNEVSEGHPRLEYTAV
jgi:hypothetical protein